MIENKLSLVRAGFQNIVDEIQSKFSEEAPWQDKLNSSLGTFLIDIMAGLYTNAGANMDIAQLESYLITARRDTSIYALARTLGVKLNRRTSPRATTRLTNNSMSRVSIAAYSNFNIAGRNFYNRESIIFAVRETKTLTLYQGNVRVKVIDLSLRNLSVPEILLEEPGFVVSTEDIKVGTKNTSTGVYTDWEEHDSSIFELAPSSTRYIETTTGDGDASFLFGDGTFGRQLIPDETLEIQYIVTEGQKGNFGTTGTQASYVENDQVTGNTTEAIGGGTFPKSATFYKHYAPYVYQSRKRLVRPRDYSGNIMLYPGVADAVVQSQRDIAPNDPTWMNVVRVCVLPANSATWGGDNPNPTSSLWKDFKFWIQELVGPHITVQSYNPKKILVDLSVEVSIEEHMDLQEVKDSMRTALVDLFQRRPGMLGKRLSLSDVSHVCKVNPVSKRQREGIDYVQILSPTTDIVPDSKLEYITLNSLNVFVKYTEREGR
jgi:hypothetical protein